MEVADAYECKAHRARIEVPLFTPVSCRVATPGKLLFLCNNRSLVMEYDPRQIRLEISEVPITDEFLAATWGPQLIRVNTVHDNDGAKGTCHLVFYPA